MTTSIVDAESVLAIDLGSVHTRAVLFDVVDGQYHFIANGTVPSTLNAPYGDVQEGVHAALKELLSITGRVLVDHDGQLILPAQPDGSGIDRLVITYSAGPDVKVLTAGLLGEVSLESAQRLINTIPAKIVDSLGLTDRRPTDLQIDAVLRADPDIVLLTGGTERGATRSVLKLVEIVMLACRVMPQSKRPQVLYAGNTVLGKKIKEVLDRYTTTTVASNVRPSIDQEDLDPAMDALSHVMTEVRYNQIGGLRRLGSLASVPTHRKFVCLWTNNSLFRQAVRPGKRRDWCRCWQQPDDHGSSQIGRFGFECFPIWSWQRPASIINSNLPRRYFAVAAHAFY
jgi:hypothetical protein